MKRENHPVVQGGETVVYPQIHFPGHRGWPSCHARQFWGEIEKSDKFWVKMSAESSNLRISFETRQIE